MVLNSQHPGRDISHKVDAQRLEDIEQAIEMLLNSCLLHLDRDDYLLFISRLTFQLAQHSRDHDLGALAFILELASMDAADTLGR